MKTSAIRKHEPSWHIIDAKDMILGRLATDAATKLRGKMKVSFVPYLDCGDHVVVINASKIAVTGTKATEKVYQYHTAFPGGLRTKMYKEIIAKNPELIITMAVKGMLPKNKLEREWLKRLHVYAGAEHPHGANIAGSTNA
jgi:large subunit ribosomal protein L13